MAEAHITNVDEYLLDEQVVEINLLIDQARRKELPLDTFQVEALEGVRNLLNTIQDNLDG